jgi:hypothetical protein
MRRVGSNGTYRQASITVSLLPRADNVLAFAVLFATWRDDDGGPLQFRSIPSWLRLTAS